MTKALPNDDYTLMIMGEIENDELEWAIENDVQFYVFEQDRLDAAASVAKKIGKKALIHVELETGMNRTGIPQKDIASTFKKIEDNLDYLETKGVCTHFAGAESIANYKRVTDQFNRFKRNQTLVNAYPWMHAIKHTASSSATIRYPYMAVARLLNSKFIDKKYI